MFVTGFSSMRAVELKESGRKAEAWHWVAELEALKGSQQVSHW